MTDPKPENPPAFPGLERFDTYSDDLGKYVEHYAPTGGMTLMDFFAAHALHGLTTLDLTPEQVAEAAYRMADAMLLERAK